MAPSKQSRPAPPPPPPPLIPVTSVATSKVGLPLPPSPQLPALRRLAWPSFWAFISSPGWPVATCLQRPANKTQVPMELGNPPPPPPPPPCLFWQASLWRGAKNSLSPAGPCSVGRWVVAMATRQPHHSQAKPSYWIALAVPPWCFINTQTAGLCPARWHAPEGWTSCARARGVPARERERQGVWLSGGDPTCSVTVLVPARSH